VNWQQTLRTVICGTSSLELSNMKTDQVNHHTNEMT
jgi:hypothetical protein